MRKVNLFSKRWCNLVFEGRNKDYGAYRIRSETGKRYRYALILFVLFLLVVSLCVLVLRGMEHYHRNKMLNEVRLELQQLKSRQSEEGVEVKIVSFGRKAPSLKNVPESQSVVPEFVEQTDDDFLLGVIEKSLDEGEDGVWEEFLSQDSSRVCDTIASAVANTAFYRIDEVEELPEFPGGTVELMRWLDRNVYYPKSCLKSGVGGEMLLNFYVDTDGSVRGQNIVKSVHHKFDHVVLNAVRRMPKWKPGKVNGVPVLVSVTIPVHFHPHPGNRK